MKPDLRMDKSWDTSRWIPAQKVLVLVLSSPLLTLVYLLKFWRIWKPQSWYTGSLVNLYR